MPMFVFISITAEDVNRQNYEKLSCFRTLLFNKIAHLCTPKILMKKRILSFLLAALSMANLFADEGMWPLTMVAKLQDPMQAKRLNS